MEPMAWYLVLITDAIGVLLASAVFWVGERIEDIQIRMGWVSGHGGGKIFETRTLKTVSKYVVAALLTFVIYKYFTR